MKRTFFVALAALLFSVNSHANLVMNISDDGFGNSHMVFSGSATVLSGSQAPNSIWVDNSNFSSNFMSGFSGGQAILSGTGTVCSSLSGCGSVFDVYEDAGFGFAPRVGQSILHSPGAILSWSGDIIAATPFANFIQGTYTTSTLMFGTIDSSYILTIGQPQNVPEPISLALFGIGLAGVGFSRRKKA